MQRKSLERNQLEVEIRIIWAKANQRSQVNRRAKVLLPRYQEWVLAPQRASSLPNHAASP